MMGKKVPGWPSDGLAGTKRPRWRSKPRGRTTKSLGLFGQDQLAQLGGL